MANVLKWSALGTFTTAIPGDAAAPTLKGLANGARVLGDEIDNTGGRHTFSDWDLKLGGHGASIWAVGGYLELHFVPAVDGSVYADGDASVEALQNTLVGTFAIRNVSTAQRLVVRRVLLPATKFKPLILNRVDLAGVDGLTANNGDNVLSYRTYNFEAQ